MPRTHRCILMPYVAHTRARDDRLLSIRLRRRSCKSWWSKSTKLLGSAVVADKAAESNIR